MTRLEAFPLPAEVLPTKLRSLLEPTSERHPGQTVEVAINIETDMHGPGREAVHMQMVAVPKRTATKLGVLHEAGRGVIDSPVGMTDAMGALRNYRPSASGYDPIVMSWGSGTFFGYNLSEKVWMSLGLSPRCFGNQTQRLVYDDPAAPEFGIAGGEISRSYNFTPSRDVTWTMRNDYLRRYLWMRGSVGVRLFFYEGLLGDRPEIRGIMQNKTHYLDEQKGNWYVLDIREFKGKLLVQVWATVPAVAPKLCPQPDIHKLVWPGDDKPMTKARIGQASARIQHIHLDDRFLERYEQNSIYEAVPVKTPDELWYCSPSYGGQWSFSGCRRIGRNLIRVEAYELYKGVRDREILHAYDWAIAPNALAALPLDEEHIAAKCQRLLEQLLEFGEHLSALGNVAGVPHKTAAEIVGFCRREVMANGWANYPMLCRLGQVAPLNMTQQAFLSRCKTLHEILQKIPNAYLKSLLRVAGCAHDDLKQLGSIKLLEALSNVLDKLHSAQDNVDAFKGAAAEIDWGGRSDTLAALFLNNELRIADAHEGAGDWRLSLERLSFDTAQINEGYGRALDFVLDRVIDAIQKLNQKIHSLFSR